jgi:hypothetical protein
MRLEMRKPTWQFWVGIACVVFLLISWVPEFFKLSIHDTDTIEFKEDTIEFKEDVREQLQTQQQQIESLTRGLQLVKP